MLGIARITFVFFAATTVAVCQSPQANSVAITELDVLDYALMPYDVYLGTFPRKRIVAREGGTTSVESIFGLEGGTTSVKRILGQLDGVEVVADFLRPNSGYEAYVVSRLKFSTDASPDIVMLYIHFDVPLLRCWVIGGVQRSVPVPSVLGPRERNFCFPPILIENWEAMVAHSTLWAANLLDVSAQLAGTYLFILSRVQGERPAWYLQSSLGLTYPDQGVALDEEEAVQWFRTKAEQGFAGAQLVLGLMYLGGEGVTRDYAEAYGWLSTAAAQGQGAGAEDMPGAVRQALSPGLGGIPVISHARGLPGLTFASVLPALREELMPPSQVERAEELAREYREKYAPE